MTRPGPTLFIAAVGISAALLSPDASSQSGFATDRAVPDPVSATGDADNPRGASAGTGAASQVVGCLIEPRLSSQVAASAPGVLREVKVERGDRVEKGQLLAVLDQAVERALLQAAQTRSETQAAVNAARATRNMAYQKLRRMRKLQSLSYGARMELELAAGELSVAESRLEQAEDTLKAAQQDYAVARHQLARREVRSPMDGVVADRLLNPGERADGQPILRIVQLDRLRVEVILPASRFGSVTTGMTGQVRPELDDASEVDAVVEQVDPFIDAASGTFRARLAVDNAAMAIPAGVRCHVRFAETDKRPGRG